MSTFSTTQELTPEKHQLEPPKQRYLWRFYRHPPTSLRESATGQKKSSRNIEFGRMLKNKGIFREKIYRR